MKAILLFGPPGIGKGTQGQLIGKQQGYVHFSMGELFRKLEHMGDVGKKVQKYVDNRELVPDELTVELFDHEISRLQKEGTYNVDSDILLLDGIPRDAHQVDMINERFDVLQIIDLYCADESILIDRIKKRAQTQHREDDAHEETIRHGLEVYHKKTEAILSQYDENIILKIDGSQDIEKIHEEIMNAL